ncbi:hypothetical protein CJU74_14920 [Pseudomonas fragi]|nr:hypothetical protein CJU74_14920 [Pseudomonas fragi]
MAFCGNAILARNERMFFTPTIAGTTLYVSLALAGVRHWFMVMYWPQTKAWLCRALNCEHCLRCNIRTDQVERTKP